jgi:YD repeat-containing protein
MRCSPKIWVLPILSILSCQITIAVAQNYPEQQVNQSYTPSSPNSLAIQSYGADPVALYNGTPTISLPVYTIKCGLLSLPITLSYNYNGLFPMQDASWVGLGWNLNAGGVITRIVEGGVDYSENTGYNYDQYNLVDSLAHATNLPAFLQSAYNNNLGYSGQAYDLAPDLYDAEFCGYSDRWVWYQGKAYLDRWDKDFSVSWPSHGSSMTITTADGNIYTFSATEKTTDTYFGGSDSAVQSYTSAWYLSSIQSADHKDTIYFNYATYTWQQQQQDDGYQTTYGVSLGSQPDLGADPLAYFVNPSDSTVVLQSITCRNSRVVFKPDTAARTDITGTLPRLREIDVIDSLSGATIKKNTFSYEYFTATGSPASMFQRLALKTFSSTNPGISSDSLTYVFKYIGEFSSFPWKWCTMDYWGYSTGTSQGTILPPYTCPYYSPSTTDVHIGSISRTPNFSYTSLGALDTIVYPTGGYTAFQYEQNQFYNSTNTVGPGICVQSSSTVSNNPTSPQVITRNYTYLQDNGTSSSGILTNLPSYPGVPFYLVDSAGTFTYLVYSASTNSAGAQGTPSKFYYSKVTESISSNGETHKSDHYFTLFPEVYEDVRQTEQIDYINSIGTNIFTPVTKTITNYTSSSDTSFTGAEVFIDTEYINSAHNPRIWYAYQAFSQSQNISWWIRPTSQVTTQYDVNNDSLVTTLTYNFNSTTRNLTSITQNTSDGQTIKQKFKYPEDYASSITGKLVAARVLTPLIEKQTWLYQNSSDSLLISGAITQYDTTIFRPIADYTIELTKSIPVLNNETISGGHYTTLLSDSRYVIKEQLQYDGNDNLRIATKSPDMNTCYIWDYRHLLPIATVKNAADSGNAYTSFEADGGGGWSVSGTRFYTGSAVTGNQSYSLSSGSISIAHLYSAATYIVSYWSDSGSYSVYGSTGILQGKTITINGVAWTYYEHTVYGTPGVSITGTGHIDEVRLYIKGALMTTATYSPLVGITSSCDADNRVTYYQYDGFNRVKVVMDQDRNIIKTYQYHTLGETVE